MNSLPPVRELPAHKHAQIRTELVRAANGDRSTKRRWLVPAGVAGAAAALVVGIAVVVPKLVAEHDSAPVGRDPFGPIPGLSADEQAAIEKHCAFSVEEMDSARPASDYRLTNRFEDDHGSLAVFYTDRTALDCTVNDEGLVYATGPNLPRDFAWLAGPIDVDAHGSIDSEESGTSTRVLISSYGRIGPEVARVTFSVGDETVEAHLANSTYAARILRADTSEVTPRIVRAYDRDGNLLATDSVDAHTQDKRCWITPSGAVIKGPSEDPSRCLPAVRWPLAGG